MKRTLLALVLASFCVAGRGAQTEPPSTAVSGSARGASNGEPPTFKTETEAIEHFQKALEDSRGGSMRAIYSAFGIAVDAGEPDESFARMVPMMRMFAAHSGTLSRVDKCPGPKLGDTIQRAGYLLLYEHGFGFVDATLFHTEKGWRVLNLKLDFNNDTDEIVKAIPGEYYLGGQTFPAAKAPAPTPAKTADPLPGWSAFSLVEPDENGGCTETIYLVNERAAPATFDGSLLVNPGESVRFVHLIAEDYQKNLTRSFQVPGQGIAVPVKPLVLKGMAPYPGGE